MRGVAAIARATPAALTPSRPSSLSRAASRRTSTHAGPAAAGAAPRRQPPNPGSKSAAMRLATCPSVVRSRRPCTATAAAVCASLTRRTLTIGVEIVLEPLMISLMRGTPSVTFMLATPAKWNVFSVICVPGSPAQVERGGRWAWV